MGQYSAKDFSKVLNLLEVMPSETDTNLASAVVKSAVAIGNTSKKEL